MKKKRYAFRLPLHNSMTWIQTRYNTFHKSEFGFSAFFLDHDSEFSLIQTDFQELWCSCNKLIWLFSHYERFPHYCIEKTIEAEILITINVHSRLADLEISNKAFKSDTSFCTDTIIDLYHVRRAVKWWLTNELGFIVCNLCVCVCMCTVAQCDGFIINRLITLSSYSAFCIFLVSSQFSFFFSVFLLLLLHFFSFSLI